MAISSVGTLRLRDRGQGLGAGGWAQQCSHLGSSHRAPPPGWLFWCHQSSGTSPLACQPGGDKEGQHRARLCLGQGKALGAVTLGYNFLASPLPVNSFPGNSLPRAGLEGKPQGFQDSHCESSWGTQGAQSWWGANPPTPQGPNLPPPHVRAEPDPQAAVPRGSRSWQLP